MKLYTYLALIGSAMAVDEMTLPPLDVIMKSSSRKPCKFSDGKDACSKLNEECATWRYENSTTEACIIREECEIRGHWVLPKHNGVRSEDT